MHKLCYIQFPLKLMESCPHPHLFTSSTGQAPLIPVSNIQFTLKWKSFKMTICYIASAAHLIDTFSHNTIIL